MSFCRRETTNTYFSLRYIGVISTATNCATEPFDFTEIVANWGSPPNYNLVMNQQKTLVFRALMGDCPVAQVLERVSGSGTFADIFMYNTETQTLDIKG